MTRAREYAECTNRISPDHLPSCPRCGNLCGQVDKWCPGCETWLLARGPSATELAAHARMREDMQPTKGKAI
jgi:hypothetical protein